LGRFGIGGGQWEKETAKRSISGKKGEKDLRGASISRGGGILRVSSEKRGPADEGGGQRSMKKAIESGGKKGQKSRQRRRNVSGKVVTPRFSSGREKRVLPITR